MRSYALQAVQERHYEYRRLELLEEDKSLSMSAGSALIQGNLTTGSPEFEKRSDELLAPNNGEDSVPKDSQAIQDETSDEPRLEETAEQVRAYLGKGI